MLRPNIPTSLKCHFSWDGLNPLCNLKSGRGVTNPNLSPLLDEVTCKRCLIHAGWFLYKCRVEGCYRVFTDGDGGHIRSQVCNIHRARHLKGDPEPWVRPNASLFGGKKRAERRCSIIGCNKRERASLYCNRHYQNYLERGDPLKDDPDKIRLPEGFKVEPTRW